MRDIWKEHKTSITLFSGAVLSLLWGIVITVLELRNVEDFYDTVKDIVEGISLSVPVSAIIITLMAGVFEMSLWFSDNARKSLKRQLKKAKKQAAKQAKLTVERDAEWIEWATNGKDPDKMPSVVNPVDSKHYKRGNTQ